MSRVSLPALAFVAPLQAVGISVPTATEKRVLSIQNRATSLVTHHPVHQSVSLRMCSHLASSLANLTLLDQKSQKDVETTKE